MDFFHGMIFLLQRRDATRLLRIVTFRIYNTGRSIWKQREAFSAGVASPIGRVIIADDSDLFGGGLEPGGVLLLIIMYRAIRQLWCVLD
jgi:hypothetical protein